MGLVLEVLGGKDEVLRHDGELVENEEVRRPDICEEQTWWGVGEWVDGLVRFRRVRRVWRWRLWLVGQGWSEAELELRVQTGQFSLFSLESRCTWSVVPEWSWPSWELGPGGW